MLRFKILNEHLGLLHPFISLPALPNASTLIQINDENYRVHQMLMYPNADYTALVLELVP